MSDLITAISSINKRDWFDYFSAFLPLILSLVAIIIAIDTSRSQNRIALFDKRYTSYSELLGFCTLWKMFIDQFLRLYQTVAGVKNDTLCELCLVFSLLGRGDYTGIDIQDFVTDHKLDRGKTRGELIELGYKNSITLEMTSLLYGKKSKEIEAFQRQYNHFQKQFLKAINEEITQETFQFEVITYKKNLNDFFIMIQKHTRPRVKITI